MISIIDYKAGNLTSVKLAFENLGLKAEITNDISRIIKSERVVFPGDGAAKAAMGNLEDLSLLDTIRNIMADGTPFLGICLGTQIILEYSEENGGVEGIGLVPGKVSRFSSLDQRVKIPQMGWNTVNFTTDHPLFAGIENESEFYFIHSYYPCPSDVQYILGKTDYADVTFASIIGRDNLFATQFHPERSGRIGLKLLQNFSTWSGKC